MIDGGRLLGRLGVRPMAGEQTLLLASLIVLGLSACGQDDGPIDPPIPTSVTVLPTSATLSALHATQRFTATVHDQYGQAMANVAVSWAISDASVATVTSDGLVTAVSNGHTGITVSAGTATGDAEVVVEQVVADISVSPLADTLIALGDTVRLSADGTDANGYSVEGVEFTWTIRDTLVATVDTGGLVTAVGNGITTVTVEADDVVVSASMTVRQISTSMTVLPDTTTLAAIGDTVRLSAEAFDANGHMLVNPDFQWRSGNDSVVSVDSVGLVSAVDNGMTAVTATLDSTEASATVTVAQVVASVAVSPSQIILPEEDTARFRASVRDSNGHELADVARLWASSDESVATVDSTGLVRARVVGRARISATVASISGTAEITVTLPRIPPNPAVDEGTSHSLQGIEMRLPHGLIRRGRSGTSHSIVYADLDRDGDTDLFYAPLNRTTNRLLPEVYLNDGRYNFELVPGFLGDDPPATVHARKALPGDFNGDSRPDVFVLASGFDRDPFPGETNYILLSSDGGYVRGAGLDSIVGYHHGGASADIDADGDLDVFVTENVKGPFFLLNNGAGTFRMDTERIQDINYHAGIYTAELVDVDEDGYVDLLVAGHEYSGFRTQVLWGSDSGVYSSARATLMPVVLGNGVIVDIDVADTDGDGDRDIVVNRTGDDSGADGSREAQITAGNLLKSYRTA